MNFTSKIGTLCLPALLATASVHAATAADGGHHYTNFGMDLVAPIFPLDGTLAIYRSKTDKVPTTTLRGRPALRIEGNWKKCSGTSADGWVFCNVGGPEGWVRRDAFKSGGDIAATSTWPFRYWLYVASSGMGGEESDVILQAARKVPYLVAPREYENVFFYVRFDEAGNAISPRTGKPTGDRVFMVDNAVYLAPSDPAKRNGATWLFLSYFNEKHNALCPGREDDSCMSAVNTASGWPGIKAMYTEPAKQFAHKDIDGPWFGPGEVAFARHTDPVQPLMYRVPDDVHMQIEGNVTTDAQRAKNRAKLFCIADCSPAAAVKTGR